MAAGLTRDAIYLLRPDTHVPLADASGAPGALDRYSPITGSGSALVRRASPNKSERSARFGGDAAGLRRSRLRAGRRGRNRRTTAGGCSLADVEWVGLGIDRQLPICGAEQAQDRFAFPDRGAADLHSQ